MVTRTVVVASPRGLEEEPAGRFCTSARAQPAPVTVVAVDGRTADARSVLGVVELGVSGGQELTLAASDHDAGAHISVDTLAELLATDLDADLDADTTA